MIDPRIALGVQPIRIESPLNALAQVAQIKGVQQKNELNQLAFDERRRAAAENEALNAAYSGAMGPDGTINRAALMSGLATRNLGSKIPGVQKTLTEADSAQATLKKTQKDAEKIDFEMAMKQAEHTASVLSLAKDPASYATVRQVLANMAGANADKFLAAFPEQYDPTFVAAKIAEGQTLTQRLADERAREGHAITIRGQDMTAETARRGQNITVRGQDLTDARGRESNAISREQLGVAQEGLGISRQRLQLDREKDERERIGEQSSGGPVLGVPAPTVMPWSNQSNPKDANKVKAQEISRGAKEIEKDVDAARTAQEQARDAKRFIELNEKKPTGGLMDKMALTRWAQSMGNEYAEMESITARLAPAMRQPGSGATSDYDARQFERATVGVDKPKQTNKNIAAAVVARSQQAQEYADFRQTYLEQNGTLQGADRHWKDYVNANPIFAPGKNENFDLNPKRKSWQEHFKAQTSGKPAPPPASGGLTPAEQEELQRLRRQLGRPG